MKMMMKACRIKEPVHPCDPKAPCDICDEGDECPKPSLCVEKLNNPEEGYETRCKPGEWIPAEICKKPDPPHPCDPPPPCKPGKPRKLPCPDPPLCKERVKNLLDPYITCPEPEDQYSYEICEHLDFLKTPVPQCPSKPCPVPDLSDPFGTAENYEEPKPAPDPNEYLYSREICKHFNFLKQSIKDCAKPCSPPPLSDPFMETDPESMYPPKDDPCDESIKRKNARLSKMYKPCCDPSKPLFMGRRKPTDKDENKSDEIQETKTN